MPDKEQEVEWEGIVTLPDGREIKAKGKMPARKFPLPPLSIEQETDDR